MRRGVVTLGLAEPEEPESPPDDGDPGAGPLLGPLRPGPSPPGGLAASTLLHALIIALAVQAAVVRAPAAPPRSISLTPRADAVFLPRPAEVRRMLGLPPRPRPPAPSAKDRISIGPPAPMRPPEPLILHRDDDLTKVAKGALDAAATPRVAEAAPPPPPTRPVGATLGDSGRLVAPGPVSAGAPGPILASLRRLEAGGGDAGPLGVPSGAGGQMGPLFFDPQGADFTAWIQHWKSETYRNWIMPPAAEFGWSGEVDFQFVVDRAGTVTDVRLVRSSGIAAYDRAARNALFADRLLPLPADYAPATLTIDVGFLYNARPPGNERSGR